jgi:hypothetical protein
MPDLLGRDETGEPMMAAIQAIFINPPNAIARLGGSTIPQDAYVWVLAPAPRSSASTAIAPTWSLRVQLDGSVEPVMPAELVLRDGPLIRPVCPFFEVWARVGEPGGDPAAWDDVPLTPSLLALSGASLADLTFRVEAKNFKAARRTGNPDLRFGTFPALEIRGDNNAPVPILAVSPPDAKRPMIPRGQSIPLGALQVIKSRAQPTKGAAWATAVNVETIRFRFMPARGHVYGVPDSAKPSRTPRGGEAMPVEASRAFLNPKAGWAQAQVNDLVEPQDTYDGADVRGNGAPSLGVVDDTCEARIDAMLRLPGAPGGILKASACVFVAPPDFAPDRRPFLSLADEINDRGGDQAQRTDTMSAQERDAWVQDLFERIFETLSLLNVDLYRDERALTLSGGRLRKTAIAKDGVPEPSRAMGGRDALRGKLPVPARSSDIPLPLSQHAQMRHRELSDLVMLREFIAAHPGRIAELVRGPFEIERGETAELTTMRMPPFMRNSNAMPLTLSAWQYALLMSWVAGLPTAKQLKAGEAAPAPLRVPKALSDAAAARREAVLNRVQSTGRGPKP